MTASAPRWEFETFLSDYEQGAFGAIVDVFPGIGEEGCFFHLCERLDFQVKELGLLPRHRVDDLYKLRVKKLAAQAFVPVAEVVGLLESLATTFLADELPLLAYFEDRALSDGDSLPHFLITCGTSWISQLRDLPGSRIPLRLHQSHS